MYIKNTRIIIPITLRQKNYFYSYSCLGKNWGSNTSSKPFFSDIFSAETYISVHELINERMCLKENLKYLALFFAWCNCIIVKLIHSKTLVTYAWNVNSRTTISNFIILVEKKEIFKPIYEYWRLRFFEYDNNIYYE